MADAALLVEGLWAAVWSAAPGVAALVLLTAGGLEVLRASPRARIAAWRAACLAALLAPLAPQLVRVALVSPAPAVVPLPAAAGAPPDQAPPWSVVRYRRPEGPPSLPALLYGAGLVASLGLLAAGAVAARRRCRRSSPVPPEMASRLGATASLVRLDPSSCGPVLAGALRPRVLLPPESVGWDATTLAAVIAHEMAHRRRLDPAWHHILRLLRCLLWFHPAAWWLGRELEHATERLADQTAAASVGLVPYGRCLARLARARFTGETNLGPAIARRGGVADRLRALAGSASPPPTAAASLAGAVLLAGALAAALPWELVPPPPRWFGREAARLASPHAAERAEALYRLSRHPPQWRRTLPLLARHLGDDAPIPANPTWSYGTDGWGPARATLGHPSPGEVAALGLASMSALAAPTLERLLDDPDPVVRRNAAWALGELRHPRGISKRGEARLAARLHDADVGVRLAAAWSLGDAGVASALPALRAAAATETAPEARRLMRRIADLLASGRNLEQVRLAAQARAAS